MFSNTRLQQGDTVLVTGATGLVGSAIVNELIAKGFRVRGATRDVAKTQPIRDKVDQIYGPGKLEFVHIQDASKPDVYKDALQGVAGIVHCAIDVASVLSSTAEVDEAIHSVSEMTLGLLRTATQIPSIKSAVITSTNATVYWPGPEDLDVSLEDYNEAIVSLAYSAPQDHPQRAGLVYSAAKTRAEQTLWKWVKETKPQFSVNTVLPVQVFGPPFNPADGVYTTSTWLTQLFEGDRNSPQIMFLVPGNWIVDVRDCAVIHTAALLDPSVHNQRLWAAGHTPLHINKILQIWREAFPDNQDIPSDFDVPPPPRQKLRGQETSTELLHRHAGRDWIPVRDTLIENVSGKAKV